LVALSVHSSLVPALAAQAVPHGGAPVLATQRVY